MRIATILLLALAALLAAVPRGGDAACSSGACNSFMFEGRSQTVPQRMQQPRQVMAWQMEGDCADGSCNSGHQMQNQTIVRTVFVREAPAEIVLVRGRPVLGALGFAGRSTLFAARVATFPVRAVGRFVFHGGSGGYGGGGRGSSGYGGGGGRSGGG